MGMKFRPTDDTNISLNAATSGTGVAISLHDCKQYGEDLTCTGTVTGGVVVFESAPTQDYSGTWNQLDSIDFSTVSPALSDSNYQASGPCGYGGFYRWRVTSAITGGGTITARVNGLLASRWG
jgi:hypothetical protein